MLDEQLLLVLCAGWGITDEMRQTADRARGGLMMVALAAADVECFRSLLARRLGLHFEDAKLDFPCRRLAAAYGRCAV